MRTCANPACGTELGVARRAQIRTCSTRCRVAVHRAAKREAGDPLPTELRQRQRWVRRSAAKVPLRADGNGPASSTNPRTWSSYTTARESTAGVGVGFVLNGDGIVCVDLDHCLVGGRPTPWVRDLLDRCPPTYVEVSPSGTGLHIWGRGHVEKGRMIRRGQLAIELYGSGRYIAIGERYEDAPPVLADLSELLASL